MQFDFAEIGKVVEDSGSAFSLFVYILLNLTFDFMTRLGPPRLCSSMLHSYSIHKQKEIYENRL